MNTKSGIFTLGKPLVNFSFWCSFGAGNKNRSYTEKIKYPLYNVNVHVMYISVSGHYADCGEGHDPCPPWEACNIHLDYSLCVKINGEFLRKKHNNVSSLFFSFRYIFNTTEDI